ncbi:MULTISPECIES: type II toxin-antitoxin system VapC family toxin [Microbacterium]|uniref:Ribonuclease VapC n=1 Tax=Microbacterium oxydans TaxID=82380 RepID=A0A3S9WFG0_9MICO|nr:MULTISPECIES: type II toxin-antitoxin system VapC family toxin [Microbacterium]AZS38793.1 Ribonuclease VapC40 [Microbacterium oxydans]KKX97963.1 ribonuclease [Microbacterium sp. Ag1]
MPTSADLLFDTSAAIALVHEGNPAHERVLELVRGRVIGLAGHAAFETYSVLTRLPGEARVSPGRAREIIERSFPVLASLSAASAQAAVTTFATAGIAGGSVYDGLVGLAARDAGLPLVTCDRRAMGTYAALGVVVNLV